MMDTVRAWSETIIIPTYRIGEPDRNPMFLEKRVYQGSSGVVYPHSVIDKVYDDKVNKEYLALFLENRYLKIMILPQIGGRVQMALDKTNGYHFVYYNRVIKPALVGLAGPWISGGIEFNWPQHHRPSTFDPLDWRIENHADGSKTVWCAEIEKMFRTKGTHGFTLYPDRAYLEVRVQLYNRTSEPQTFLWWANPAVHVHDEYQSVFPPDVHAVMDHGKRDVSNFPIATGTYYKVNYSPGTDISRYKNIPVPTSYMAYYSDFDFLGDYDHRAEAGMLHVANHHIVPGKKQWTWGNGEFGKAWDRQLTDEDGPYVELMCGAYTDNQPDFSWIQPGEEKSFNQIFMPYKKIGPACNANEHAVLSLEVKDDIAKFGVYTSAPRSVTVKLVCKRQMLYEKQTRLDPEHTLLDSVALPIGTKPQELTLSILEENTILLGYTPLPDEKPEIPAPAIAARLPEEIESNEELFLNGLHLEQYRHATYSPEPYYLEALRRDPGDSRCNNAMGLLLYRRGKFAEAEQYFRKAVARLTLRNPNPYDGEPYYNLGLAFKMQGGYSEAFNSFHKAVWNAAWQDAAYFELARLASRDRNFSQALDYAERSLSRNRRHHKARHLKIALLRCLESQEAVREINIALEMDSMEYGALWESNLLLSDPTFNQIVNGDPNTCSELALDYAHAGLWNDAIRLLSSAAGSDPLVQYLLGWIYQQMGDHEQAYDAFQAALTRSPDYCFPNRLEDVLALEAALKLNPSDARAAYYLGNFWYSHRRYEEAIQCWENSRANEPRFPTVHRNLGLAYYNKHGEKHLALNSLEKAFALNQQDARVLFELDQLYKKLNHSPAQRLAFLQNHLTQVNQRDDLYVEMITLFNLLGKPKGAFDLIQSHKFHPWEGGEGKVTSQYVISLVEMAKLCLGESNPVQAIEYLQQAQIYPENLGEGKLYGAQENNIFYYLGQAYTMLGKLDEARSAYERATIGLSEPASPMFYNDQPPDMIFYQGMAQLALGHADEAGQIFQKLIAYGRAHEADDVKIDYFAISLPDFQVFDDDLSLRNLIHCHYMMALGYLGLADSANAQLHFEQILSLDVNHIGATIHQHLVTVRSQ
jgi:tetratricopeptide (TPR) repeat protein